MLLRHICDQTTAFVDLFAIEQHLRAHDQITVEQPAQTDQHDRAVGCDIAQLVRGTGLGRNHPSGALRCFTALQLDPPAAANQQVANTVGGRLCRLRQHHLRTLSKRL